MIKLIIIIIIIMIMIIIIQVIQRRTDGSENFDKTFLEYENGFGNFTNEFWLGNVPIVELVHSLVS